MNKNFIIKNGIPYSLYWQGDDDYRLHPMKIGRWLFYNNDLDNLNNILKISKLLPNGGLSWYYPNDYKLNRMIGKTFYSCISQSEFLSAFCLLYDNKLIDIGLLNQVFDSFLYDGEGGIFYNDSLLELPLDRNYPEIILNGWLHAITRIIDYYKLTGLQKEFLDKNLKKLSEILYKFDDEEHKLSKYSDMCPYKITILNSKNTYVLYDNNLKYDLNDKYSDCIYDTQIVNIIDNKKIAYVGISSNTKTILINDTEFTIIIDPGVYSLLKSLPINSGNKIEFNSQYDSNKNYHFIDINNDKLFKGYPTNFAKSGFNFYHIQHIICLLIINNDYKSEYSHIFDYYIKKWSNYIDHRKFCSLDYGLESVNKGKFYKTKIKI